jgi:HEAT repeat protein
VLARILIVAGGAESDRTLDAMLRSREPALRAEVVRSLGRTGVRRAIPFLARLLDDADRRVRFVAAGAMGEILGEAWASEDEFDVEAARAWWDAHRSEFPEERR